MRVEKNEEIVYLLEVKKVMESLAVGEKVIFDEPLTQSRVQMLWKLLAETPMAWEMEIQPVKGVWGGNFGGTVSASRYR
jgi:hypothetical protein